MRPGSPELSRETSRCPTPSREVSVRPEDPRTGKGGRERALRGGGGDTGGVASRRALGGLAVSGLIPGAEGSLAAI